MDADKRRLKDSLEFYPSDFKLSNHLLNSSLNKLSELEFLYAENFFIPFGTSILAVAKKNDERQT